MTAIPPEGVQGPSPVAADVSNCSSAISERVTPPKPAATNQGLPTVYKSDGARSLAHAAGWIAGVVAVASLGVAAWGFAYKELIPVVVCLAFWAIVPPVWFWIDWFFIYGKHGDPDQIEQFKHGQQLSAAIWAAMALFLGALASSDRLKENPPAQAPGASVESSATPAP
jgi:hypothetical protein